MEILNPFLFITPREKEKIIGNGIGVCNIRDKKLKKMIVRLHKGKIFFPEEFFKVLKINEGKKEIQFCIRDKNGRKIYIQTSMIEPVQIENILTALTCLYVLKDRKVINVSLNKIITGIKKTTIPARFTKSRKGYYLSVAHNPDAIKEMLKAAKIIAGKRKIIYIYSCLKDKDIRGIFNVLSRVKNFHIILTKIDNERAINIEKLWKIIVKYGIKYHVEPDNYKALQLAYKLEKNGIIIIGGSFYLVNRFM